jgi:hypothetical protein
MKKITLLCLIMTFCLQGLSLGQEKLSDSLSSITILSIAESVDVFDGSQYFGTTPLIRIPIKSGLHVFQYAPAGLQGWNTPAFSESVFAPAGDSLLREIELPIQYRFTSEPYGAAVMDGDSILAYTPAIIWLPGTIKNIHMKKPGYEDMEFLLTRTTPDIHGILIPVKGTETAEKSIELVQARERSNVPIYAVASIAVVSGVIAAISKINADHYYDDYRNTGNEGNISKIHSFDRISGISMVIEEISLATLTYLLLRR